MKEETLAKAKALEKDIDSVKDAMKLRRDLNHYALLEHYAPDARVYHLPRKLNDKIVALLAEELECMEHQLEVLSDDNDGEQDSFEPTGKYANGLSATQQSPSAAAISKRAHARLVWCMVALYAWLIFCIIYWLLGFSNWITTVSNTLFTAFFIYLVDFERRRINKNKE